MQIESLKAFCDVVKHRSFSQAAAINGITQSAVSQIVSHIEKRIGVDLIDRSTRPLRPTPAGKAYCEGCQRLVQDYYELEASIAGGTATDPTQVRVAAIYSVGLRDMHRHIDRFRQLEPHVDIQISYLHPDRVREQVLSETADLGILSFPRKTREMLTTPWREEKMVIAVHTGHPLAGKASVPLSAIAGEPYIAFDRGLTIRREIDRWFKEAGVGVDIKMEFDNIENIKNAVALGEGIALLPEPPLAQETASGTLVAIPISDRRLLRPIGFIHRRHRLGAWAMRFMNVLLEPDSETSYPADAPSLSPDTEPELVTAGTGPESSG